jgi:hypothetical protein
MKIKHILLLLSALFSVTLISLFPFLSKDFKDFREADFAVRNVELFFFLILFASPISFVLAFKNFDLDFSKKKEVSNYFFLILPIVLYLYAFLIPRNIVGSRIDYTRNAVIESGLPLIQAIETYKIDNQVFPEKLENLKKIPTTELSKDINFTYKKMDDTFQLSVYYDNGSNWERLIYDPNDLEKYRTPRFSNYEETEHRHWMYYWTKD